MNKLLALDLFNGGGGACIGMQAAGFEVYGIDNRYRKHYPGTQIVADIQNLPVKIHRFDLIWASPPCQKFSRATPEHLRDTHIDLIEFTRELLKDHPFTVIENVPEAPLRPDIVLTGTSVGLTRLVRKRIFECSFFMMSPPAPRITREAWKRGEGATITTSMSSNGHFYHRKANGLPGRIPNWEAKQIMGIPDHIRMTSEDIGRAVAPPKAELIARAAAQLIRGKR